LRQLDICLRKLPRHDAALAALAALRQKLNAATVPELSREGLHDFIDEVQIGLSQLHDQIAAAYFAH
jgi:uncharacterized alpha-E superfamily protein